MFYQFLYPLHTLFSGFNVFRYITFRCAGATITSFLIVLLIGPEFIEFLRKNGIGQVIRSDGPESHLPKKGVPTMGGILVVFAIVLTTLLWVNLLNRHIWIILFITLWFAAIGGYDDWRKIKKRNSKGLSPRGKMVMQIIGALIAGFFYLS